LVSISAGDQSACGLTATGQAYCWGFNNSGQLGNGTTNTSSVPVAVSGGIAFGTISGPGGLFGDGVCGLAKAGQTYCWGFGFLGNGSPFSGSLVPIAIADTLAFASISVNDFTCAVSKAGVADCWGIDGEGELGNGSSTPGVDFDSPVAVLGGLAFSSVGTGFFHACGLTKGGQAYCWGQNFAGQLGTGDFSAGSNVPVAVSTGLTFTQVSVGQFHTCALTKDGTAYCWGANGGQLGNGSTNSSNVPVPVAGGITFASITAGASHTCALTKAGVAYCWGSNFVGEAGTGTGASLTPITTPSPVAGGFTFASLSAGAQLTCGVAVKLGAFCWGNNASGQVGNGSTSSFFDAPSPVAIP
jgi:alpha-tubulin suppressor-like RCC1 family protein